MEPDPERSGAFLDLAHGMTLYPNKELKTNDEQLFDEADFIFYTAGTPNIHGGSRLSTAESNTELTRSIFQGRRLRRNPFIIIITNPVDLISQAVQKYSGLPPERVIGTGTFLDSVRLSYYLSELSDYQPEDFESVVLGEHGDSQVAIYSMTTVNGLPIEQNEHFSNDLLTKAAELTTNAAFQIRETQKGTMYGVSKCAEIIMDHLIEGNEVMIPLSIQTNTFFQELLELNHPIYISLPTMISASGVKAIQQVELTEHELIKLRESAKILSEIM